MLKPRWNPLRMVAQLKSVATAVKPVVMLSKISHPESTPKESSQRRQDHWKTSNKIIRSKDMQYSLEERLSRTFEGTHGNISHLEPSEEIKPLSKHLID